MTQAQKERPSRADADEYGPDPVPQPRAKELSDQTADLLDEIDDLLNEMPQGLVENFKQVGGQ